MPAKKPPEPVTLDTFKVQLAFALVEEHGRPVKLATQIALNFGSEYFSRGLSPKEAAAAWAQAHKSPAG